LNLRLAATLCVLMATGAQAETLRIATFNAALSRDYAAHLIRDVERRDDQVMAIARILAEIAPDIILLTEFDRDPQGRALTGFVDLLAERGLLYPHTFAGPVNTGVMTGLDMDQNGELSGPNDAQGWGRWPGHYGMALLSRYPIDAVRTFQLALWADVPDSQMPVDEPAEVRAVQRLSTKSHWDAQIALPNGQDLHVLAAHPSPPCLTGRRIATGAATRMRSRGSIATSTGR